MKQSIVHIAIVVRDYDEALEFYIKKLNFVLVEDTYQPEQVPFIGNQAGGRVFLFLNTDDFWRDYHNMVEKGIQFIRQPHHAAYGMVAVFEDLYGNLWDLLQLNKDHPLVQLDN